ncbi:MAG: GGDEF domain-containing protein [Thermodesulfobacteriota bacterium]
MICSTLQDPKQILRLKRTVYALVGYAIHTFIAWLLLRWRLLWLTPQQFLGLFGAFWLGHLVFPLLIITGLNLRFKDPSFTLLQMSWATLYEMTIIFFAPPVRMMLLMYYLVVVVFGAFRLRLRQFLFITGLALASYGLVIFSWGYFQVTILDLRLEIIQWVVFGLAMGIVSVLGTDLSNLRATASRQNKELAQALGRIEKLAITDELTGVWNRRQIMRILQGQKALVDRGGYSFVVCFLDLDRFKRVNDRYGHHAGDLVLQTVASEIKGTLREIDYFARFGGEEFLAVLANTALPAALPAAERLHRAVEAIDFRGIADGLHTTVSIGVTDCRHKEPLDDVLHRADQALYAAKRAGRNRVVSEPAPPPAAGARA